MTPKRELLRRGELTVLGRIRSASNATFLCEAQLGEQIGSGEPGRNGHEEGGLGGEHVGQP